MISILAVHVWRQVQQSHRRYQIQTKHYIISVALISFQAVNLQCVFLVLLPGKVFWSSVTAGNSFTSSLSSLLRVSQQLHSKFTSCFVCNSCKWKDFRCQPLKPGTSSQLTRILYTSPRPPVSTCTKYHEEESTVKVGSLREIFPNPSAEFLNLTINNGKVEFEARIRMMIESTVLFNGIIMGKIIYFINTYCKHDIL